MVGARAGRHAGLPLLVSVPIAGGGAGAGTGAMNRAPTGFKDIETAPAASAGAIDFSVGLNHAPAPTASSAVTASGERVSMKELTEKTALPGPATP